MRRERQITLGRMTLASVLLLAVWVDPTEPPQYYVPVCLLLSAYAVYSLALAITTFRSDAPWRFPVLSYVVDLLTAFAAVAMTGGVRSPLFPLVVFVLFAAALRWRRKIAAWTTVGILGGFLLVGDVATLAGAATFDLNDLILRTAALGVLAAFLTNVTAYENRVQSELERLATPPELTVQPLDPLVHALLEWGAGVIGVRRAVLVWEDPEEPWLHMAEWRGDAYQHVEEPIATITALVAPELAEVSFLTRDAEAPNGPVLHASTTGLTRWRGAAVDPTLRGRFAMKAVLSLAVRRELVNGRLFFLDQPGLTADELRLGEIVSRHVAGRLNHFYLRQRLKDAALLEDRLRVARDLHDSGVHVLMGMALDIERLVRMPEIARTGFETRLREVQDRLVDGQRRLRELIDELRMAAPALPTHVGLEVRLQDLAERVQQQWGVAVRWAVSGGDELPAAILDEVYLMVHEALVNVGRHAGARTARVEVFASAKEVRIEITDDGRGFGFTGRYDHAELVARQLGPWTITARAASLGGTVAIASGMGPTTVEIWLPTRSARS